MEKPNKVEVGQIWKYKDRSWDYNFLVIKCGDCVSCNHFKRLIIQSIKGSDLRPEGMMLSVGAFILGGNDFSFLGYRKKCDTCCVKQ